MVKVLGGVPMRLRQLQVGGRIVFSDMRKKEEYVLLVKQASGKNNKIETEKTLKTKKKPKN